MKFNAPLKFESITILVAILLTYLNYMFTKTSNKGKYAVEKTHKR